MKISFVTTVLNEQETIKLFLNSLLNQSKIPDEIIIADGGSTDKTVLNIKRQIINIKDKKLLKDCKVQVLIKNGNRAVGRNEAIKKASGDIILTSDAGCVLDKHWVKNIVKSFEDCSIDVVAGYYKGFPKNIFQKCLIPYVLVMPNKIDKKKFLPSSRSMAFRKLIWKKAGGFPKNLSHNEDYAFAKKLEKIRAHIVFIKNAVVKWIPRKNLMESFMMFFRFAFGDIEAGIFRTKVLLLFARYFLGLYFIFLSVLYKSFIPLLILMFLFFLYLFWSIKKNYRYVSDKQAFIILPLIQLTADIAVLSGTIIGLFESIQNYDYIVYFKNNKILFLITTIYIFLILLVLSWGIPNKHHPFPYHMDEWHQLQAVRATFKYGTPNVAGAANGTMFQFLLSGFYIIPFTVFQIINPFSIKITDFVLRGNIIELLRMNTIINGVLSIFILYNIAKIISIPKKITICLFTFTPIWLSLSNYFKYDIALMLWILLSVWLILRFYKNPTPINYLIAAIPTGLAVAVKISAIPLLLIYAISYFLFTTVKMRKYFYFISGILISVLLLLLFGMPDSLFGRGNIHFYLYDNLIISPSVTSNFKLENPYIYLFFSHYPSMFGHGLMLLFGLSIIFWIFILLKEGIYSTFKKNKVFFFILFSLLMFVFSLLPLRMQAVSNRALVLLPFLVLIIVLTSKKIASFKRLRILFLVLLVLVILTQIFESFGWFYIKLARDPQETSSEWIKKNIPKGQLIGIENIPIYQFLPNIIEQEYYFYQYHIDYQYNYKYKIIDSKSRELPSFIVITSGKEEEKFFKQTPKKELLKRLYKDGYKKIASFSPDLTFLKYVASDLDYYASNIVTAPLSISVYKK